MMISVTSASLRPSDFIVIITLLEIKDITYERIGQYTSPFKIFKDGDGWVLEQQENFNNSKIKDEGNNKISVNDFPL